MCFRIIVLCAALIFFVISANAEDVKSPTEKGTDTPAKAQEEKTLTLPAVSDLQSPDEEKLVLTAGEITITVDDFLSELEKSENKSADFKAYTLDAMVEKEVLYIEALKQGFDKAIDEKDKAALSPKELKNLIVDNFIKNIEKDIVITDEDLKDYYEKHKKEKYMPPTFWKSSMLTVYKFDSSYKVVTDLAKKECDIIREKLLKGESPEDIWKFYSRTENNPQGLNVQLTPVLRISEYTQDLPKEMIDSLPSLKADSISQVFELKDSFNVLKVNEIVPPERKISFEEAKESIKDKVLKIKVKGKVHKYVRDFVKINNPVFHNTKILK